MGTWGFRGITAHCGDGWWQINWTQKLMPLLLWPKDQQTLPSRSGGKLCVSTKNVICIENAGKQSVVSWTSHFHITLRFARLAVDKEASCSPTVLDGADITLHKWSSRSRKHLWKYRLTRGWHFAYISLPNDLFQRTENTLFFTHTNIICTQ